MVSEAPIRLTAAQSKQLLALSSAGAISREAAKGPFDRELDPCNAMVVGKLRDLGLADSRTLQAPGGSQTTVYWLTPAGVAVLRRLMEPV